MLDYQPRQQHRYQPTAEDRRWLWRRLAYYLAHPAILLLIVCTFGPNLFLFRSPLSPSPSYYAGAVGNRYVTAVAAVKAYQKDKGSLPIDTYELIGLGYLPQSYMDIGTIDWATSVTFWAPDLHSVVSYEFTPGSEGWSIFAPRYHGPLSLPLVAPGPSTHPATTRETNGAK